MSKRKNKIKALLNVLSKCENTDQVEIIRVSIKNEKTKFIDLSRKPYFKDILDLVFGYYEINRDGETEEVYNYLLQLIDTSVSTEE